MFQHYPGIYEHIKATQMIASKSYSPRAVVAGASHHTETGRQAKKGRAFLGQEQDPGVSCWKQPTRKRRPV